MKNETSMNDNTGRENGVVYTPESLANYVAHKTLHYFLSDKNKNKNKIRIIDPACGDGALLEAILNVVKSKKIPNLLFGIDIDEKSIESCRNSLPAQFMKTNSLCPLNSKSLSSGWGLIMDRFGIKNGFDILIANPPWGADISKYKHRLSKDDFKTLNGQFDSYELFFELAMLIVRPGGYFSFIVPDSVLNHGKCALRGILLKNTQIKLIARLGEKIFPNINRSCVIAICKNEQPNNNSVVDCFRLKPQQRKLILKCKMKFSEAEKESLHRVNQTRFMSNKDFTFNIDLRNLEVNVLKKFRTDECLRKHLTNARGIELSGKGEVCKCSTCGLWIPIPNSTTKKCPECGIKFSVAGSKTDVIVSSTKSAHSVGLINGYDVKRYHCKPSSWIKMNMNGIQYKDASLYKGNKILVRKTGVGITASIDYSNSYTTQVVYIFKLRKESNITLEFVLALLNSRAYYFYLMKNYGEIEWRSHPYLTQNQVLNLPIPNIENKERVSMMNEITRMVRSQIKGGTQEIPSVIDAKIERMVSQLFALTKSDYKIIFDAINSAEELLPIRALKDLQLNEIFS